MPTILRWIGVNNGPGPNPASIPPAASSPSKPPLEPVAFSGPDAKQFGMENFGGHTCYANSVLQALYFCQPFRDLVCMAPDRLQAEVQSQTAPATSQPPASEPASEALPTIPLAPPTLFSALRALYIHISTHPAMKGTVSPTSFINKLKKENEIFRSSMHQDAHEFLNYLLNKIVEDLEADMKEAKERTQQDDLSKSINSLTPSSDAARTDTSGSQPTYAGFSARPTLVQNLFEGVLTNETRCLTCETVSSRDESFLDLSIDIEQNSSVTACLRQFSASEMLCQKNKFFCDSCCSLQEAEKRMKIKTLPNVLALHLKRFKLQPDEDKYVKLAYRVAFPLELRLFNTVDDAEDPDRLYTLFSIVVHIGGGPHHGHYITIVKAHGGVWRVFDDDNVYPISESDIPKYFGDAPAGAGYVLFYQAADLNPEALGLSPKAAPTPVPAEPATTPAAVETPSSVPSSSQSSTPLTRVLDPAVPVTTPVLDSSSPSSSAVPSSAPRPPPIPSTPPPSNSPRHPPSSPLPSQSPLLPANSNGSTSFFRTLRTGSGRPQSSHGASYHKPSAVNQSMIPPPVFQLEKDKDKDKATSNGGGWFSRVKRKDSISTIASAVLAPVVNGALDPTSKSSRPSQTSDKRPPTATADPLPSPRRSTNRPKTAPGVYQESPSPSPTKHSFNGPSTPNNAPSVTNGKVKTPTTPPVPLLPSPMPSSVLSSTVPRDRQRTLPISSPERKASLPDPTSSGAMSPVRHRPTSKADGSPSPASVTLAVPRPPRRASSVVHSRTAFLGDSAPRPPNLIVPAPSSTRPSGSLSGSIPPPARLIHTDAPTLPLHPHSAPTGGFPSSLTQPTHPLNQSVGASPSSSPQNTHVGGLPSSPPRPSNTHIPGISSPSMRPLSTRIGGTPTPYNSARMPMPSMFASATPSTPTPLPNKEATLVKRASRKLSFTGGLFGGWGKDKDRDKDSHPNDKEKEKGPPPDATLRSMHFNQPRPSISSVESIPSRRNTPGVVTNGSTKFNP